METRLNPASAVPLNDDMAQFLGMITTWNSSVEIIIRTNTDRVCLNDGFTVEETLRVLIENDSFSFEEFVCLLKKPKIFFSVSREIRQFEMILH